MNLKYLSTKELDTKIKSLAQQERELLHQVLITIKEIDSRRMYFELGCSSLFAYLTIKVGYTNGSAQRRIDAAKLLKELPEIGEKIESGKINLGHISLLQEASREVFKRSKNKVTVEQKRELITSLTDKNHKESQKEVSSYFNIPILVKTRKTVQSDGSVHIELTLSKELAEQIERAQGLLSHAVPSADLVDYLDYVTKKVIQQKTSIRKNKSTTTVVVNPNTDQEIKPKQEVKSNQKKSVRTLIASNRTSKVLNPIPYLAITNTMTATRNTTQHVTSKPNTLASRATRAAQAMRSESVSILNQKQVSASKHSTTTVVVKGFSAKQKKIVLNQNSRCMHKDHQTGQVCGSRWFLQVDHKQSLWAGGTNDLQNAQVLCAQHNQEKYRRESRIDTVN